MAEVSEEPVRNSVKTVKDVPADEFIKAFAGHLKKSGKVNSGPWSQWRGAGRGAPGGAVRAAWACARPLRAMARHGARIWPPCPPGGGAGALPAPRAGARRAHTPAWMPGRARRSRSPTMWT